jgi:hypothetical protein
VPELPPPFAPARATFPCPALLGLSAKASLGGAREALLGAVMAARLATGMRAPFPLPTGARVARADGAKSWIGAITMPTKVRTVLLKAFVTSATDDREAMAVALDAVMDVTAPHLDRVARSELARLAAALRGDGILLAGPPDAPVE